ncbi:Gfo/Idh/MocA family protein [Serratia sp. 1D1416]|uniref:Gfo/Idh/MocA family protein n=1 Tax=Serratia sp. 1D1416 TaxID=2447890 RepID=UPI001013CBC9|nr:Gfo/Idh/MocA family oxidoreductase [Serratia sp. 1D1416]
MADLRVLVVGCGNMGASHAEAYHGMAGVEICGLVARGDTRRRLNARLGGGYPEFSDFAQALAVTRPDAVCLTTWPDTHEPYALAALAAGCHLFIEKPLATTVAGAERVIAAARAAGRQVVVGYILRHHPSWRQFVELARGLGKPLVMRMNLNQQSHGAMWDVHRNLMQSLSPIVDCGVHYLDVMCQMTESEPIGVSAIGARLSDALPPEMYNYGQLQVRFADGSVGWYEAGWGPMISETAFFVKDVIGPLGAVSIVARQAAGASDNVDAHTRTESLRIHYAQLDGANRFVRPDRWIDCQDEPDHLALCLSEQRYFLQAIREGLDLGRHWQDAVNSLRVVLAADEAVRGQKTVTLGRKGS